MVENLTANRYEFTISKFVSAYDVYVSLASGNYLTSIYIPRIEYFWIVAIAILGNYDSMHK